MAGEAEKRVCVAAVAGAFGVRGEVRLKPFTAEPEAIADYGPLETEDGARRFAVRLTRAVKGGLAARLSGVETREAAEALRGARLYALRAALPEPDDEDEFYHADLIGLAVEAVDGLSLGRVKAIHNHGAGDLLEIDRGAGRRAALIAFTRETAPIVDVVGGRVVLDPPAGALDEDAPHEAPAPDAARETDEEGAR